MAPTIEIEIEIRDAKGVALEPGTTGIVYLPDADGWFCTGDRDFLDADGYLFIQGRSDDTIIRGGENVAPAEIEEVLLSHPGIAEACVVGLPDYEWGHRIWLRRCPAGL